jgi:hypothetical protein
MIGEVVDAAWGELLDGPHEQRGTTEAVRRADLGWSAVGDVDPRVARDGHHRTPAWRWVQVDVDAGQREHGVRRPWRESVPMTRKLTRSATGAGRLRVVEAAEDVRHARDVAGELLDGEERRPRRPA